MEWNGLIQTGNLSLMLADIHGTTFDVLLERFMGRVKPMDQINPLDLYLSSKSVKLKEHSKNFVAIVTSTSM